MFYLGNDTFRLMSHKFIKINSPQGLYIIKRMELKKIVIDAKSKMIDAILALLEEHPPTDPAILDQINNMRGGTKV